MLDMLKGLAGGLVAFALILLAFGVFYHFQDKTRMAECAHHRVTSVGGCDKFGDCGVILDDGRKMVLTQPVAGERCR